ncbi:hypothetical protein RCL1_003542 [Eukaryota sp. TZLM3-RCL]
MSNSPHRFFPTCLFRSILLSLEYPDQRSFHHSRVATLFLYIYKIGNISKHYRKLIFNLLSQSSLLERIAISSRDHTSQLIFLQKHLPLVNLSIFSEPIHNHFSCPLNLKMSCLSLGWRFRVDQEPLFNFISNLTHRNTIQQFTLLCACFDSLWTTINTTFPSLTSLFYYESSPGIDNVCIPCCLSMLVKFKAMFSYSLNELDVSCLVNLEEFSFSTLNPLLSIVKGLSCLSRIKYLKMFKVSSCDVLHKDVVLCSLVLGNVSLEVMETLLTNQSNLINCRVSLKVESLEFPDSFNHIITSKLTLLDFTTPDYDDGRYSSLSTEGYFNLESLSVSHDLRDYLALDLINCERLCEVNICSNNSDVANSLFLSINVPLFLLKLTVWNLDCDSAHCLIYACSFLKHLDISACNFSRTKETLSFSLNYLEELKLTDVTGLLPLLPVLPRLRVATFYTVDDFDFNFVNTNCKQLCSLEVDGCPLVGDTLKPNSSIWQLSLSTTPSHALFLFPTFFQSFHTLQRLSLTLFLDVQIKTIDPCVIRFPSGLRSLNISGPWFPLKDTLIALNSLVFISGSLYVVNDDDLGAAEDWVTEYSRCRQHCKLLVWARRGR